MIRLIDPSGHFWFIAAIVAAVQAVASAAAAVVSATWAYIAANAGAIFSGALVGGTIGGVSSVAMGGDFWQGFGIGAIGGGVFAGLAPAFNGLSHGILKGVLLGTQKVSLIGRAATLGNFMGATLTGAATGAAVAGINDTDIGKGAWMGAAFAGAFATADLLYKGVMNTDSDTIGQRGTMKTADGSGQPRMDSEGNPLKVTGSSKNPNRAGIIEKPESEGLFHAFAGETGPVMSFAGKNIPGVQGMSLFHDNITTGFRNVFGKTANSVLFNFPSMPPSYAINAMSAVMNDYPVLVGQSEIFLHSEIYGEESN